MAGNDLTVDIKYVDTAAAIFAASRLLGKIVWSNMSDGHTLVISDAAGVVLYSVTAAADDQVIEFDFNGYSSTLTVTTIDL